MNKFNYTSTVVPSALYNLVNYILLKILVWSCHAIDLLVHLGFFDRSRYNSSSFEICHYNSPIRGSATVILSLSCPCHFLQPTCTRSTVRLVYAYKNAYRHVQAHWARDEATAERLRSPRRPARLREVRRNGGAPPRRPVREGGAHGHAPAQSRRRCLPPCRLDLQSAQQQDGGAMPGLVRTASHGRMIC